jgi:hypothetical protein
VGPYQGQGGHGVVHRHTNRVVDSYSPSDCSAGSDDWSATLFTVL